MPRFSDTQDAFRHGLAGAGVPAGLAARGPGEIDRRFAVYRNNVTVSLVNALRLRFPVIERLVGEEFAREMFRAFAVAHPPDSPLMMRYGGHMPAFLAEFPPVRDLSYLPDVARLELARGRAYHAADVAPMSPQALAAAAALDGANLLFRLHPSVTVLRSTYPVFTIWSANQPGALRQRVTTTAGEAVLVARSGLTVVTDRLEPADAVFVALLAAGAAYEIAAGEAFAADDRFDPAPALARLLRAGLVVGTEPARAGPILEETP